MFSSLSLANSNTEICLMQINREYEKTFVILKPEAYYRNLTPKILDRIHNKGYKIIGMKLV
jgi:hypothetical protein